MQQAQFQESLPSLDSNSAAAYKQVAIAQLMNGATNLRPLVEFLDLYENPAENAQIVNQLDRLNTQVTNNEITRAEAVAFARMLLPTKPENGNEYVYSTRNSGINLAKARAYAERWATRINPKYGEKEVGGVDLLTVQILLPKSCTLAEWVWIPTMMNSKDGGGRLKIAIPSLG
ncbi:hypothetical protein RQN30_11130 [Arcanobacterium hippocoleae]